jgi:hypothetical protein
MNSLKTSGYQPPRYPVIGFLVRRGVGIAVAIALLALAAALLLGLAWGSLWVAIGGALAAALLLGLLLSYVEVLRLISDMLLPKY